MCTGGGCTLSFSAIVRIPKKTTCRRFLVWSCLLSAQWIARCVSVLFEEDVMMTLLVIASTNFNRNFAR